MKAKKTVHIILTALAMLCFQMLYYRLTILMMQPFMRHFPGWSDACYLMVHHTLQFGMLFIPTLWMHRHSSVDFGYHISDWRKGLGWLWVGIALEFIFNVIPHWLNGHFTFSFQADAFVFQLFFSGLGEEIAYRALPLALFPLVWGQAPPCRDRRKYAADMDILISALLFTLAHMDASRSWFSLTLVFAIGVVLGKTYRKTNSVWACMIAHGIFNVIAITL